MQLLLYNNNHVAKTLVSGTRSCGFVCPDLSQYAGCIFRLQIKSGDVVDSTTEITVTEGIDAQSALEELIGYTPEGDDTPSTKQEVCRLRIMQYNVGKFNNGKVPYDTSGGDEPEDAEEDAELADEPTPSVSNMYHYLTSDNYEQVLSAYKTMLGNAAPDIIGIEEWEDQRTVYDALDPAQIYSDHSTVRFNTDVFDRLYPFGDENPASTGLQSKRAIKSKFPIISSKRKKVFFDYQYGGETRRAGSNIIIANLQVGTRVVKVIVCAMQSGGDPEEYARRQAQVPFMFSLFDDDDEYAFLICDANHAGCSSQNITGREEGNAIAVTAAEYGFASCMGSYFPWAEFTWKSKITGHTGSVDQIFYKSNGKIVLNNFVPMTDQWETLISDHVPVYADFLLL